MTPVDLRATLAVILERLERAREVDARVIAVWSCSGRLLARVRCGDLTFRLRHEPSGWSFVA